MVKMEFLTKITFFVTEFVILGKKFSLYEVPKVEMTAWKDFKLIFSRPLLTIILWPKMVILNTDSILTMETMYEFLIVCLKELIVLIYV